MILKIASDARKVLNQLDAEASQFGGVTIRRIACGDWPKVRRNVRRIRSRSENPSSWQYHPSETTLLHRHQPRSLGTKIFYCLCR
jgi:hypothetical protein